MHAQNPLLKNATGKGFPKYSMKQDQKKIIANTFLFCCRTKIYSKSEKNYCLYFALEVK